MMYLDAEGVPQSYQQALEYFVLAANKGHASAQNNVGIYSLTI